MRNSFLAILTLLFVLPVLAPMFPHGLIHELHDHHAAHHNSASHDEDAETHPQDHFDLITNFGDFLHVDLKSPENTVLNAPQFEIQDVDYPISAVVKPMPRYELASVQSRAPPDAHRLRPDKTPLYLSTLRLRI